MAEVTLSTINNTLTRVDDNTESTSRGIGSFIDYLKQKEDRSLERLREEKAQAQKSVATSGSSSPTRSSSGGMFSGLSGALKGLSLATLAPMIGKKLLTRVLGPAAIAMFADDIVEFLLPEGFENQAIKDALSGGLTGGAIGFAVGGPLGAAIGAGIGALMKNENFKNAMTELGTTLKEQGKVLLEKLEPTIIRFKESFVNLFNSLGITKEGVTEGLAKALKFIGDSAASGVESITKLIKGDFEPMDIVKGITTIGAVAALLMPGKFIKFLGLLAGKKGLLGLLTKGAAALGLGSLLGSSKIDAPEGGGKPTPKPQAGSVVRSAKGNLMIAGADGKATAVKAPPGSKVGDVPKGSGVAGKFGRMAKFLRLPGIAQLMAGYDIYSILNSDSSRGEKVKALTEVFGGLLGGVAGLKVGGLIGGALGTLGFPLIGTGIGGVLGAGLGYFGGKALAGSIAEFLLGGDAKPKMPVSPAGSDSMRMGRGGPTQTFTKPSTSGDAIKSQVNRGMSPGAMGGSNVSFSADTNTNISNSNTTNALISNGPAVDLQDQMLGGLT